MRPLCASAVGLAVFVTLIATGRGLPEEELVAAVFEEEPAAAADELVPEVALKQHDQAASLAPEVRWFKQPVDHSHKDGQQFQQRYLTNFDHFKEGGPILFGTGNELSAEKLWENLGFVQEICVPMHAAVVLAEHRAYGKSKLRGLKHLTVDATLKDFQRLIEHLRKDPKMAKSPVIAFGGSYGGMLAAWMRMTFPESVAGSIASSAPVRGFVGLHPPVDPTALLATSTRVFRDSTPSNATAKDCSAHVHSGMSTLTSLSFTTHGRETISKALRTCSALKDADDVEDLRAWMESILLDLAMMNYPYAANFIAKLPAFPVKTACRHAEAAYATHQDKNPQVADLLALRAIIGVETGDKCLDHTHFLGPVPMKIYNFQACTELVNPIGHDGKLPASMFSPASRWSLSDFQDGCQSDYPGSRMQPHIISSRFGDSAIARSSNIVFTNGDLDPWHRHGVLKSPNTKIVAMLLKGAAHHLDLRSSREQDPPDVKEARTVHVKHIQQWIKEWAKAPASNPKSKKKTLAWDGN